MSFDLNIIDDNVAEHYDYYYEGININVGMYESDEMVFCDYHRIYIEDNDGMQHTAIILLILLLLLLSHYNNC